MIESVLEEIREILWNLKTIEQIEHIQELVPISFLLFKNGSLIYEEFVSFVKILASKGIFKPEEIPYLISLIQDTDKDWFNQQKKWHYELSFGIPNLAFLVSTFSEIFPEREIPDSLKSISALVSTIERREGEFFTHIGEYPTETLRELLNWVKPHHSSMIAEELLKRNFRQYKSWKEVEEDFATNEFLKSYPPSFKTLGNYISDIPQTPFDANLAEKIPQSLLMKWLPKFTFSRPEIEEQITIHFPGGEHIGHSAILLKTRHGMILLDFGMSVLNNRIPHWKHIFHKVDAIFLSHAHLDHSGALPIFHSISPETPIFSTKETKILSEILWTDTANVLKSNWNKHFLKSSYFLSELVREKNIIGTLQNINEIEIGKPIAILPNVEVTPYHASHLFGSVGFDINIAGKRIFYTGDFNADGTAYFQGAKFPIEDQTVLMFDGTYYGRKRDPIDNQRIVNQMMKENKRLLIPAFSVGRTQEVLFHLLNQKIDSKWKIYVAGMGVKVIRRLQFNYNPNGAKNEIEMVPTIDPEDFTENTIVISGNGMLQAGTIRKLLDATADDEETGVLLTGYQAPNTLGYQLLTGNPKISTRYKQKVAKVSMSGHTSGETLNQMIQAFEGTKVIVHSPRGTEAKLDSTITPPHKAEKLTF
ncbi:MAG: MBL fold metallo-hydrolase [Methanobacteriota archaeon]|nr:MAG: MBL fold metallo-hydrolase [Euryarchaeota archaeon]